MVDSYQYHFYLALQYWSNSIEQIPVVVDDTQKIACKQFAEDRGIEVVGQSEEFQYGESTALTEPLKTR